MPDELQSWFNQGQEPWFISPYYDENGESCLQVLQLAGGLYFQIRYCDETLFILDHQGTRIWATWPDNLTLEDTATYFLGPVIGFVLRLRGVICLHASAVVINHQAVIFVGDAGAGKSTTSATFAKIGYSILSDDIVALVDQTDQFWVQPAYPRVRLWSPSVEALYKTPDALPRIVPTHPTWDKRYLDLNQTGYHFQQQPVRLGAVYLLQERAEGLEVPIIEPISTQLGLIALAQNTYTNYLLDKQGLSQEFAVLSRLSQHVPLRQLTAPANLNQLQQLCDAVIADFLAIATKHSQIHHAPY